MRKTFYYVILIALVLYGCGGNKTTVDKQSTSVSDLKGNILINGSDVLFPLASKWASAFKSENPGVSIDLRSTCSDNAIKNLNSGLINVALVSRELTAEEKAAGLVSFPVAMDIVVPIISFDNDNIQKIVQAGITKEKLTAVFTGKIKTWGQLINNKSTDLIEVNKLADTTGTCQTWANFLGVKPKQIIGTSQFSNRSMSNVIIAKKFGIGFCSMSVVYDLKTNFVRHNLYVVPIDLNANGQADDNELVFDKLDELKSIISAGQYPSPPVRKLYFVTKSIPTDPALKAFVKWTLGIGQNYSKDFGLVTIDKKNVNESIKQLK